MRRTVLMGWRAGRVFCAFLCAMLLLGVALTACGGGSENQAGVGSGGTGSYTSGPVAGFGSIIVNGIRYDDSSASVTDADGNARSRADVLLGMTVTVQGSAVSNAQAAAQSVQFGSELIGPVASSVPDSTGSGGTLTVLGQTVKVTAKTFFNEGVTGYSALTVGDVVEVYGLPDGQGNITATRIERKTAGVAAYSLRGVVRGVPTATRLVIGSATIAYGGAEVRTSIVEGALVSVRLQTAQSGSNWVATRVQSAASRLPDQAQAHIEGVISTVLGSTRFVVNGMVVEASAAVQAGAGGALGVGARVEVEGSLSAGVLTARSVNLETDAEVEDSEIELHGIVSGLDTAAKTFVVRSTTVAYASASLSGGALIDGACVEMHAKQIVSGSQLQATEVEVKSASECH